MLCIMNKVEGENENICRICLATGASIPIFVKCEEDILSKLNLCLGEEIPDVPGYPRSICEACNLTLNEIVLFIHKYKESCKVLEEKIYLNNLIKQENDFTIQFVEPDYDEPEIELEFDSLIKAETSDNSLIYENFVNLDKEIETKKDHIQFKPPKKEKKKQLNSNRLTRVAASFLEGEFMFERQEQWRLIKNSKDRKPSLKVGKDKPNIKKNLKENNEKPIKQLVKKTKDSSQLCEFCGKSFKCGLAQHLVTCHKGKKELPCKFCSKVFNTVRAMQSHIRRMHLPTKWYECAHCPKKFGEERVLNSHVINVHLKQNQYNKRHSCKICGKKYFNQKHCITHERTHTGERPFICDVCNASFHDESYLKGHMRLHTGETPFKCPVCGRGYAQNCNMKSHIKHNHKISDLDENTRKTIDQKFFKYMKP